MYPYHDISIKSEIISQKLFFPVKLGTYFGRAGNIIAAYHRARFVNFTGKKCTVPIQINTAQLYLSEVVNDPVTGPDYVVVAYTGDNILSSFFFPSLKIFRGNISDHVNVAACAAPMAGNVFIFFHL
jgi:hypothetical protein